MSTGNLTRDSTHCLATPGLAITTDSEFLKRMRVHQVYKIVRSSQLAQRTAFESVVREEKLAEAVEGSFLDLLMMPRRPLNPMRLAREVLQWKLKQLFSTKLILTCDSQKSVAQVPTECNLVAQVMRGFNIPVRSSTAAELAPNPLSPNGDRFRSRNNLQLEDLDGKPRGISERTVRPYVEIQFQHRKVRTAAGDGPNPCWNETLTLPFEPPGMDFRPENLQVVRDNVYFNIFDEFVVDLNVDDRDRRHRINQRKERNWLGTIVVPFTTLYEHAVVRWGVMISGLQASHTYTRGHSLTLTRKFNFQIDGYFHVKTPPLLNGYEKDSVDESAGVNTDETMLSLFITLEPLLKQPVVISPRFESAEDQAVLRSVKRWQSLLLPKRPVSATAIDISGKTVLACRYIRAQPPPVGMATIEQVLAFVSSIPYLDDRTTLAASIDLWSTADQMLEIGAGDEAEHAILLCNYLLSFGLKSWVVLGKGIPEGKAAYVLTEHSGQYGQTIKTGPPEQSLFGRWFASAPVEQPAVQRWSLSLLNPLSGLQYHPGDAHCPLKEISCVFNHENVGRAWQ